MMFGRIWEQKTQGGRYPQPRFLKIALFNKSVSPPFSSIENQAAL